MGMAQSTWGHALQGNAINIRNAVQALRLDIETGADSNPYRKVSSYLTKIENEAVKILDRKMVSPLSSESGAECVLISDLIDARISQLWENEPYSGVPVEKHLLKDLVANVSSDWFRRALDILIDNAVKAMEGSTTRLLRVSTKSIGTQIEIRVADNGPGIPQGMREKLFREQIAKPDGSDGSGIGLLMAQTIIQTYKGTIELERTSLRGTTFLIKLPSGTVAVGARV
jgi:signal transduction histidine kinase